MPRNRKPVLIGYVDRSQAVGALAALTSLLVGATRTWDVKARLSAIDYVLKVEGLTAPEANRLVWGIADATLSTTEIAEALTAEPTFKGDIPAAERARRPVRVIGPVVDPAAGGSNLTAGGSAGHAKVGLTFAEPIGYNIFVHNWDLAAAMTTGATVMVLVKEYAIDVE